MDDYLRVSIAHDFTIAPKLFPDSFFLPAYFWIYGLALFFGKSLGLSVLQITLPLTWVFSAGSTALSYLLLERQLRAYPRSLAVVLALAITLQPLSSWVGGVPLSESLALCFTLVFLLTVTSPACAWIGAICMALASLTRYECIPLSGISLVCFYFLGESKKQKWIHFIFQGGAMMMLLLWQLMAQDPFAAITFSTTQGKMHSLSHPGFKNLAMMMVYFAPLSGLGILSFRKNLIRSLDQTMMGTFVLTSVLPFILPALNVGYYPLVYPGRVLLFLSVFSPLYFTLVWQNRRVLWRRWALPLSVLLSVFFMGLSFFPQVEVKPETLAVTEWLEQKLQTLDKHQSLLFEKNDLGWTPVWAKVGRYPQFKFDRQKISDPSRIQPFSSLEQVAAFSNVVCVVVSSKQGKQNVLASRIYEKTMELGKYQIFCRKNPLSLSNSGPILD